MTNGKERNFEHLVKPLNWSTHILDTLNSLKLIIAASDIRLGKSYQKNNQRKIGQNRSFKGTL